MHNMSYKVMEASTHISAEDTEGLAKFCDKLQSLPGAPWEGDSWNYESETNSAVNTQEAEDARYMRCAKKSLRQQAELTQERRQVV